MKRYPIFVTDHAALRYLERVRGLDLAALKNEIAEKVCLAEDHLGACSVNSGGFRYILEDNRLITVIHQNRPANGKGKRK